MCADGKKILFSEAGEGGGAGYSVYIRGTDGSPAVRLGEGSAQDLSPDGEWALAIVHPASDPQLVAYPTGAGEPKVFSKEGLSVHGASFTAGRQADSHDGERAGTSAADLPSGHRRRQTAGSDSGRVSGGGLVSSDGKLAVVAGPDRKTYLYPLSGGSRSRFPTSTRKTTVDQISLDGRFLFVHRAGEIPAKVFRLDLATGKKELWRTLMPADAAGVGELVIGPLRSGEGYYYSYNRTLSDLYLIDGVR